MSSKVSREETSCIKDATHRPRPGNGPDIDAGWAWVIAGASMFALAIASGVYYTFSMYFSVLLSEFEASRAVTAWVGSLNNGIYMLGGPIATYSIRRLGCRTTIMLAGVIAMIGLVLSSQAKNLMTLFFTYGIITAFGLCLNYTAWIILISERFQKKHALAFSLSQSGVGIGIFAFGPLLSFLIDIYGWRGAFLVTGGCTFQLTLLGALVFPPRENWRETAVTNQKVLQQTLILKNELEQDEAETYNDNPVKTAKQNCFPILLPIGTIDLRGYMLHFSSFFWLLATSIPYILLADFARYQSLDGYYVLTLSTMGVADCIGRLATGPAIQYWSLNATKLYGVTQLVCSLSMLSFVVVVNGIQMVVQGFIFSLTFGVQCVLLALVPRELYGSEKLSEFFGITMFFGGAGLLIGPPLGGLIVDSAGTQSSPNHWLAFLVATVVQLLAASTTFGSLYINRCNAKQDLRSA